MLSRCPTADRSLAAAGNLPCAPGSPSRWPAVRAATKCRFPPLKAGRCLQAVCQPPCLAVAAGRQLALLLLCLLHPPLRRPSVLPVFRRGIMSILKPKQSDLGEQRMGLGTASPWYSRPENSSVPTSCLSRVAKMSLYQLLPAELRPWVQACQQSFLPSHHLHLHS